MISLRLFTLAIAAAFFSLSQTFPVDQPGTNTSQLALTPWPATPYSIPWNFQTIGDTMTFTSLAASGTADQTQTLHSLIGGLAIEIFTFQPSCRHIIGVVTTAIAEGITGYVLRINFSRDMPTQSAVFILRA